MKFLKGCKADAKVDLVYRVCPLHLLEPMELIKGLKEGQVLEILTDYDGVLEDIPAWCAQHGQEFIGICEDLDECYNLYIRKVPPKGEGMNRGYLDDSAATPGRRRKTADAGGPK
jgi:TusA-related sulfurtransferase